MVALGIDPGIETTGFGVVERMGSRTVLREYGVIRTTAKDATAERLQQLYDGLQSVLQRHPDVEIVGVEELFFAKNVTSAIAVGQARGVILFTLHAAGVTIEELKPSEVKAGITGNGQADKKEMQRMIQLECGLAEPPQPDDAADAVAIALCAALRHNRSH